jgi:hypothetical protein
LQKALGQGLDDGERFDAVQAFPAFPMRPLTACFTALSRSASSSTMKASPPVKATARMRGSPITWATCSLEMNKFV